MFCISHIMKEQTKARPWSLFQEKKKIDFSNDDIDNLVW